MKKLPEGNKGNKEAIMNSEDESWKRFFEFLYSIKEYLIDL